MLQSGELSLSTLSLVAGQLKADNYLEILKAVAGKSRLEVESYLAQLGAPKNSVRESIKPILVKAIETPLLANTNQTATNSLRNRCECATKVAVTESVQEAEERFEVKFSVSKEVKEKVERAQMLLSHKLRGSSSLEATFEALLDEFIERRSPKEKAVATEKPTAKEAASTTSVSRYIPAKLKREVFKRDSGCCAFVGKDGRRCQSRWQIEIDHIKPFAVGGKHELENLRLLCSSHNKLLAERYFQRALF